MPKLNKIVLYKRNRCKVCNLFFISSKNRMYFCSDECREAFYNDNIFKCKCKTCGKEFETTFSHKCYCSNECKIKANNKNNELREMIAKGKITRKCSKCGLMFKPTTISMKVCVDCRKEIKKTDQPCWRCRKATGGCSWSKNFIPIKGWKAKKDKIYTSKGHEPIDSYRIKMCPEFMPDIPRKGS